MENVIVKNPRDLIRKFHLHEQIPLLSSLIPLLHPCRCSNWVRPSPQATVRTYTTWATMLLVRGHSHVHREKFQG